MIRAIAIDDEPIALEVIKNHATKVPFLKLETTFTNAYSALAYLAEEEIHLIFLDIKMPDISGIDFYNSLPVLRRPLVVFTTAYSEHAVTGFDLDALDYLLKPFPFTRFLKACNKARDFMVQEKRVAIQENEQPEYMFIKNGTEHVRVIFDDIFYVEATGNYVNFVLREGQIMSRMTITECQAILGEPQFLRVHRSFLVAVNKIQKIERHQLTIQGYILPVGNSYVDILQKIGVVKHQTS